MYLNYELSIASLLQLASCPCVTQKIELNSLVYTYIGARAGQNAEHISRNNRLEIHTSHDME